MSNYTIELRFLLAAGYIPSLSEYPIFSESYRDILNKKILDHYNFQEIGLETPDRFDFFLKTRMNEIMPYYNTLYSAQLDLVNPLRNIDITEINKKNTAGTNISSTAAAADGSTIFKKGKSSSKLANSDTPQGNLTIMDLTAGGYASNVQAGEVESEADSTTDTNMNSMTTSGEGASTEDYIKTIIGNSGVSKSELFQNLRDSLVNIDLLIIHDLIDLFMGVY